MAQRKYHLIGYKAGEPTYSPYGSEGRRIDFGWFNTIKFARQALHNLVLTDSGIYLAQLWKEEDGNFEMIEGRRAKR